MKGVFSTVAKYPATWFALAVVVVAEWAIITWFEPPAVITLLLVALGAALLAAWPLTMAMTGTIERLQFEPAAQAVDDAELRSTLEADLRELHCEQGAAQIARLRGNLVDLTAVLERRLDAGELTYTRYLGTARRVYLSAIDNLKETVVALTAVGSIDPAYLQQRLTELRGSELANQSTEIATLESRGELRDKQLAKVNALLAQNEEAMTALSATASALADAPIGRAPADAEAAMAELDNLAKRAAHYASP
jgi:hypothetical protein